MIAARMDILKGRKKTIEKVKRLGERQKESKFVSQLRDTLQYLVFLVAFSILISMQLNISYANQAREALQEIFEHSSLF